MAIIDADQTSQQIQPPGTGGYLVVNTDTAFSVYIGPQRPVTPADVELPAQASVALDGSSPWFVSTTDAGIVVEVAVLPTGLAWANPVGVQQALGALGLAKDSTVAGLGITGVPIIPSPVLIYNL